MAIKEDKSFTGTQIGYRSLLLEKGHGVSVSSEVVTLRVKGLIIKSVLSCCI